MSEYTVNSLKLNLHFAKVVENDVYSESIATKPSCLKSSAKPLSSEIAWADSIYEV